MRPLPRPSRRLRFEVSYAVVNIVLLLVFFFLTTGRLVDLVRPDIRLSETSELPLDALPSPILVVDRDGAWQLDGRDLTPELLAPALALLPQPVVLHVLINRDAPADALVSVIARPELRDVSLRLVTLRQSVGRNE